MQEAKVNRSTLRIYGHGTAFARLAIGSFHQKESVQSAKAFFWTVELFPHLLKKFFVADFCHLKPLGMTLGLLLPGEVEVLEVFRVHFPHSMKTASQGATALLPFKIFCDAALGEETLLLSLAVTHLET